jgi:hypothetical protein
LSIIYNIFIYKGKIKMKKEELEALELKLREAGLTEE